MRRDDGMVRRRKCRDLDVCEVCVQYILRGQSCVPVKYVLLYLSTSRGKRPRGFLLG